MNIDEIRAEVQKGVKAYKVFNTLADLLDEISLYDQQLSEKKKIVEKKKKEISDCEKRHTELKKSINDLEIQAKPILDEAKKQAKDIKQKAEKKAEDLLLKTQSDISKMISDNDGAKKEYQKVLKQLAEKNKELDDVILEIEAMKDKVRKIL